MEINPLGAVILGHDSPGMGDPDLTQYQNALQRGGVLTNKGRMRRCPAGIIQANRQRVFDNRGGRGRGSSAAGQNQTNYNSFHTQNHARIAASLQA